MPEAGRGWIREALKQTPTALCQDLAVCGLTPELRRTALRNGGVLHASTQAEPRSGLGLNELLGLTPVENFSGGNGMRPLTEQMHQFAATELPLQLVKPDRVIPEPEKARATD